MSESNNQEYKVIFQPSGRRGAVAGGASLKEASRQLGVDIEGICGDAGTCGKCKVRIEQGFFGKYRIKSDRNHLSSLTEAESKLLNESEIEGGYRLACQARIRGDVAVYIPEESRMGKQVIRKAATKRSINLKPAVKKYYVELKRATLEDTLGDWERLQEELDRKFGLNNLIIDYQVLLDLQDAVRKGDWSITVSVWMGREVIKVEAGSIERSFGIAIDIGTTTVAGYLCDLEKGDVVITESIMNPQVIYGEDVMARIAYCAVNNDGLETLHKTIIKGINELAGRAAARAKIKRQDIIDATVVGNTCMHHLLLNIDPYYLGKAPFSPAIHHSIDVKARDIGFKISTGAYVHVLPIEAGFVGADNVGVLIAEEPYRQSKMELIIDIGTNGELILGNREKLLSCSCATGPAFEGAEIKHGMRAAPGAIEKIEINKDTREVRFKVIGKEEWNTEIKDIGAKGICGSGIIDSIPQLFLAGIIDHTGRFKKELETPRFRKSDNGPEFVIAWANETTIGQDIVVCQQDVRNVQLAKGALYAGARVMMRKLGVDSIDRVILAGAFGSYIDRMSAAILGMFPDCEPKNVYAVGNAAGDGARIALLNVDKRIEANKIARNVEYVELTLEPDFNKIFSQAMWFPHMKDSFPILEPYINANKREKD